MFRCRHPGNGEVGKGCGGRREKETQGSPQILKGVEKTLSLESGKGQEAEVTLSWACTCLKELVL